jgi:hypothetical protein
MPMAIDEELFTTGTSLKSTRPYEITWKSRSMRFQELLRIMSDTTQPLPIVTNAFLDGGFSSSRFRRFGTTQSNKVLLILNAWAPTTAPHHNIEAFVDGA